MKLANHHYSNYLISVQFDPKFIPETLSGQIEYCKNFLSDLGELAHEEGVRLFATCSIASGKLPLHAHFAVNWIPKTLNAKKYAKNQFENISRYTVARLLDNNFFVVDNPTEAIKRITHGKKFVTSYVINQPKDGQTVLFDFFFSYPISDPKSLVENSLSNSSTGFFAESGIDRLSGCLYKYIQYSIIAITSFVAIIYFFALLF